MLRVPQARLLQSLIPSDPNDSPSEWPIYTRMAMNIRAGYTAISGTSTRALNGIRHDTKSGPRHKGLVDLGYVKVIKLNIDGVTETNYQITPAGIKAFQEYITENGNSLPPLRDAALCTNDRYQKEE